VSRSNTRSAERGRGRTQTHEMDRIIRKRAFAAEGKTRLDAQSLRLWKLRDPGLT